MNTDTTASQYAQRCFRDLGQQAHDSERVAIWCYDNPPRKALPVANGPRERFVYIDARVYSCLCELSRAMSAGDERMTRDALANAFLTLAVKDQCPALFAMFDRHQQEQEKILADLRGKEPELEPVDADYEAAKADQ